MNLIFKIIFPLLNIFLDVLFNLLSVCAVLEKNSTQK